MEIKFRHVLSIAAIVTGICAIVVASAMKGNAEPTLGASIWYPNDSLNATLVDATWGVEVTSLANCDTIDTDANGVFSCGTDDGGTAQVDYLSEISDVSTTSLATYDVLYYNGSAWVPTATSSWDTDTTLDGSLYFTLSDWYATTTDGLTEGSTNLYYDQADVYSIVGSTTTLPLLSILESQISDLSHYTDFDVSDYISASTTMCVLLTGSADLCDGSDDTAAGAFATSSADYWAQNDLTLAELSDVDGSQSAWDVLYWDGDSWANTATTSWDTDTDTTCDGGSCTITNAGTAAALAANGANCGAGNAPLGVDAAGAVEGCFDVWTESENTSAGYIANITGETLASLSDVDGSQSVWDFLYWDGDSWANIATTTFNISWDDIINIPAGFADGTDDEGSGGSAEHTDAGDYVYPNDGDYHSAPHYVATSTATSSFKNLGGVLDATQFSGADIGAQINAAYAELPATGGTIYVPRGIYSFSTEIEITTAGKPAVIECAPGGATRLTYTGSTGTSTEFDVDWSDSPAAQEWGLGIQGCWFYGEDNGYANVGLEVGGTNGGQGFAMHDTRWYTFGTGLYLGDNVYIADFENNIWNWNGQNIRFKDAPSNSGESIWFENNLFEGYGTYAADCVDTGSYWTTVQFINNSFDDCGVRVGAYSMEMLFSGNHFENPSGDDTEQYTFITIDASTGGESSVYIENNGFYQAKNTTRPSAYIDNNGATAVIENNAVISNTYPIDNFVDCEPSGAYCELRNNSLSENAVTNVIDDLYAQSTAHYFGYDFLQVKDGGTIFGWNQDTSGNFEWSWGDSIVATSSSDGDWRFEVGTTTVNDFAVLDHISFDGVVGNEWSDFCVSLTGSAELCDGDDASGTGGSGLATSTDIADTYVIYGTASDTVGGEAAFTYDDATDVLSFLNASSTYITATNFWGTLIGDLTGNADTATALAANGANCDAGNAPLGVDASGAAESCFDVWTEVENTSAGYQTEADVFSIVGSTTTLPLLSITESQVSDLSHYTDFDVSDYITGSSTLCVELTGSAALCDGDDATGGGASFYQTFSTSTAYTGQDVIHPVNDDEDFMLGTQSTSTAPFWWDVSEAVAHIGSGGAGDSFIEFAIDSVSKWVIGTDDSDSDKFVISDGGTLGTNNVYEVETSTGNATSTGDVHTFTDGTNGLRITPGATTTLTFF